MSEKCITPVLSQNYQEIQDFSAKADSVKRKKTMTGLAQRVNQKEITDD